MSNIYINALKNKGTSGVKAAPSERRQAMLDQNGSCAKCKKEINPMYSKFVRDPATKKMEVICMNCAVNVATR